MFWHFCCYTVKEKARNLLEWYYPLLLVKDFGSKEFVVSNEFMTNADVLTIATKNVINNPINPFTGNVPLEIEHIDGDANNTSPDNVTLLCPNCHSLTSTYRGANRGRGRPKTWIPKSVEVDL